MPLHAPDWIRVSSLSLQPVLEAHMILCKDKLRCLESARVLLDERRVQALQCFQCPWWPQRC